MSDTLDHLADLAAFVEASPSSYHAVAEAARRLTAASFTELAEVDEWPTGVGRFFVIRDGAIVAWITPPSAGPTTPFRIVGAHSDSPGFVLKPRPVTVSHGWLQAGVEVYGGPLLNSWLDRELEFAGRLVFEDGTTSLVRTGPVLRFPQLAVHLDRSVNTDGLVLNPQVHMNPVIGVIDSTRADLARVDLARADLARVDLIARLATLAGRPEARVVGYDIVVADTAAPRVFGIDGDLFASGRLDNLGSVHAGLTALLTAPESTAPESGAITVFAAFDHEEVGSESTSGAAGSFLEDVLVRLSPDPVARARAFAASWCLSADAGHAVHPNYPERHDPANRPIVNGGPLLKINANQRYATDALGAAEWARACGRAGVRFQEFVSSNAVPCGSTIGPITATRLGIRTIDVGIPLLSMHSARELCGVEDPFSLARAVHAFITA